MCCGVCPKALSGPLHSEKINKHPTKDLKGFARGMTHTNGFQLIVSEPNVLMKPMALVRDTTEVALAA